MNICLDWFQFSGFADFSSLPHENEYLRVNVQNYSTRHFKHVAEIEDIRQNKKVGVVAWGPHSAALPKNMVLVKIANFLLYQPYLKQYVFDLLELLKIEFNNLTRVDICRDFQFLDYRKLPPQSFIKNFLKEKYIKTRRSKGQVYFNNGGGLNFQYIKFGSAKSRVCSYIYNKTIELNEVENKPYIRELWKKNGINESVSDVWRCEFRLQNFDFLLTDRETGEQISYNGNVSGLNSLDIIDNFSDLFKALCNHYLEFKIQSNDTNTTRKKTFYIFKDCHNFQFNKVYNDQPESGRSEKIFIKKLWQLNNELRGTDYELSIEGENVLNKVIQAHQLQKWAINKAII